MRQVARLSFPSLSIAWVLAAALIALLLALAGGGGRTAAAAADCKFVLGFKALHAMIPDTVGACLENEQHHPGKGVTLQRTKNGLLVWQKASNHTAFTDGHRTWVSGPLGLQQRLNTERFDWERAAEKVIRIGAAVSETGQVRPGKATTCGRATACGWTGYTMSTAASRSATTATRSSSCCTTTRGTQPRRLGWWKSSSPRIGWTSYWGRIPPA